MTEAPSPGRVFRLSRDTVSAIGGGGSSNATTLFGKAGSRPAGQVSPDLADDLAALLDLAGSDGSGAASALILSAPSQLSRATVSKWLHLAGERLAFVVAESDEDVQATLKSDLGLAGRALPVSSLTQALELCVDLPAFLRRGGWARAPGAREAAIPMVFEVALSPAAPPLDWYVVERVAVRLLEDAPIDSPEEWQLAFSRDVARRHQGADAVLAWPEEYLPPCSDPRRFQILSHVVQSAADGDLAVARGYASAALAELADGFEPSSPELVQARWRLRGAVGRALAAVGDVPEAFDHSEACVAHWRASHQPSELSFPLCESLRLAGLMGDASRLAPLLALGAETVTDDVRGHLGLALGRACSQTGQHGPAVTYLSPVASSERAPAHVRGAARRWLVRSLTADGKHAAAAEVRAALIATRPTPDQAYLTLLDDALRTADADAAETAVRGLLGCGPLAAEAQRALERAAAASTRRGAPLTRTEVLRRLADEYRY